jgi:hypothetical protein
MTPNHTNRKKPYPLAIYLGYVIIFANLLFLLLFLIYTEKYYFQSDSATKMLLASEIIKSGTIIPPDWYYANGDIWIFFLQLPLVFFEKILGCGWESYVANSIVYLGVYAWSVYYFTKQLQVESLSKILLFVLAFSAFSPINADMFFGQLAGIIVPIFIFTFLGILQSLHGCENKKSFWLMGILVFTLTINNPSRMAIFHIVPAVMIIVALYIDTKSKKYLQLLGTTLLSFLIASAIYIFLLKPNVLINYNGAANLSFATYEQILNHINIFVAGVFSYANLVGSQPHGIMSKMGGLHFLNFFFFFLMIVAIIKQFRFQTKNISLIDIVSLLFIYYVIIIGYLYIFTIPLAQDNTTFRYFGPLFYLAMIFLVYYILTYTQPYKNTLIGVFLIFLTLANHEIFVNYIHFDHLKNLQNKHQKVADYLVDHNLTYGFAGYWDAGVTMSLTENKAVIAPIELNDFTPARWLSSESWYHDYQTKRTFLLYSAHEYQYYAKIKKYLQRDPVKKIEIDGYIILIYDYNIAFPLNRIKETTLQEDNGTVESLPSVNKE